VENFSQKTRVTPASVKESSCASRDCRGRDAGVPEAHVPDRFGADARRPRQLDPHPTRQVGVLSSASGIYSCSSSLGSEARLKARSRT
jgi:hypothetical protein